jgi:hypothetical protein
MDLPELIEAQLQGRVIRAARLVKLDFLSGTIRLWEGNGPLVTADGERWQGLSGMGRVGPVSQAYDGAAPEMQFILAGVDETFAAKARAEADEYRNRIATTYLQFFADDWACLDAPIADWWGRMHSITASRQPLDEADGGGFIHVVSLSVESWAAGRRRPRFGYMTDRDQQLRFPGDKGCERVAGIEAKNVTWPDY